MSPARRRSRGATTCWHDIHQLVVSGHGEADAVAMLDVVERLFTGLYVLTNEAMKRRLPATG